MEFERAMQREDSGDCFLQEFGSAASADRMGLITRRYAEEDARRAPGTNMKGMSLDPWNESFSPRALSAMVSGALLNIAPSRPLVTPYACRHPALQRTNSH